MAQYSITNPIVTAVTDWVIHKLGHPLITVELDPTNLECAFNEAVEEYSYFITQWAIETHIDNALGLTSAQDFTARWVSQSFNFHDLFTRSYSVQANVSTDFPMYKDYIVLTEGQAEYQIKGSVFNTSFTGNDGYSGGRVISEVLWYGTPAIMKFMIEPWADFNWVNQEFGWAYMGNSLLYVTPMYYSIQLAMNTEMREKIRKSEFQYSMRNDSIYLTPVPSSVHNGGVLWYWYWREADIDNPYSMVNSGAVVNNPGTIQMDEIAYESFNSVGKHWVKRYTLASAKEMLARIRGKFQGVPLPGGPDIQLDYQTLEQESKQEMQGLKEELLKLLEETRIEKLLEYNAASAKAVNDALQYEPLGIYLG